MRRAGLAALAVALLVFAAPAGADPDGDTGRKLEELTRLLRQLEEAEAAGSITFRASRTVPRVLNVGDLTIRLDDHVRPNLRPMPAGSEISEDRPLFGATWEGRPVFLAVDELAELVRSNVAPAYWERDDVRVEPAGPHGLLVLAEPEIQEEVRSFVGELRERVGRLVTTEVRLLRLEDGAARPPSRLTAEEGAAFLARARAGDGATVVAVGRITGFEGQRVSFWRGRQLAYLQDYDVEVAQTASIGDPIVSLFHSGLAFDVRAVSRGRNRVVLDLVGEFSGLEEPIRTVATAVGPVQAPKQTLVPFAATISVPNGGYSLLSAGGGGGSRWAVLVSATAEGTTKGGAR